MNSGAEAAAVSGAIAQAIKASGVVICVSPEDFLNLVYRNEGALIVYARSKFIRVKHKYLTSYKGLAFFTKSDDPLHFAGNVELVEAKKIWVPEM